MQPGQPIQLSDLLPAGMASDDAYMILSAIAAFLVVLAAGSSLIERDRFAPRLKAIQERRSQLKNDYIGPRRRKHQERNIHWMKLIVSKFRVIQEQHVEKLTLRMVQAGYRSKDAVTIYGFCKVIMPLGALLLAPVAVGIDWRDPFNPDEAWKWLVVIGSAFFCSKLPDILVANKRQKRYHELRKALPDALDLLLVCAEAGLSLAASLDRVARELGQAYPELAEELGITSVELGFLPDRATAFRHLTMRADMREVRGIVNVLQQTEKYGTPVAQALRVLSGDFRKERMLRAEQKAARLPVLMTVPMICFILPTLFIIVMAPAIIGLLNTM